MIFDYCRTIEYFYRYFHFDREEDICRFLFHFHSLPAPLLSRQLRTGQSVAFCIAYIFNIYTPFIFSYYFIIEILHWLMAAKRVYESRYFIIIITLIIIIDSRLFSSSSIYIVDLFLGKIPLQIHTILPLKTKQPAPLPMKQ